MWWARICDVFHHSRARSNALWRKPQSRPEHPSTCPCQQQRRCALLTMAPRTEQQRQRRADTRAIHSDNSAIHCDARAIRGEPQLPHAPRWPYRRAAERRSPEIHDFGVLGSRQKNASPRPGQHQRQWHRSWLDHVAAHGGATAKARRERVPPLHSEAPGVAQGAVPRDAPRRATARAPAPGFRRGAQKWRRPKLASCVQRCGPFAWISFKCK